MDDDRSVLDLVLAARDGRQDAWDELVPRFMPLVLAVVRRHRLPPTDVEDVVQTVWLRLVEHLDEIREPEALPGWVVTTSKNECLRVIKAGQRSRPFDPMEGEAERERADSVTVDEQVLEDLARAERQQLLLEAFATLPEHQRQLLLLLLADPPLQYSEISERLGIPIGSIGPTRGRALDRIRRYPPVARLMDAGPVTRERRPAGEGRRP